MNSIPELIGQLNNVERIGEAQKNYKVVYRNGFRVFVKKSGKHTYKLAIVDPENPFKAFTIQNKEVREFYDAVVKAYKNQCPTSMKPQNLTKEEKKKWSLDTLLNQEANNRKDGLTIKKLRKVSEILKPYLTEME